MSRNKEKILIVDDDKAILLALGVVLEHAGFVVMTAKDGPEALRRAYSEHPDLVLLDVGLPGMDGFEVLERLHLQTDVPILMLTARSLVQDRVRGLYAGAVDYIIKPFDDEELLARIRSHLREFRRGSDQKSLRAIDRNLSIDLASQRVLVQGKQVSLTPIEWRLLRRLLDADGLVVSIEELLEAGWGAAHYLDERSIKVRISSIRRKIGDTAFGSRYIHTVREIGYRFAVGE